MSLAAVREHYDGGPGAIRMAWVHAGEDEFGIWFAGALVPGLTEEQVAAFTSCSVSGDWREVWKGHGLDLVACLAGVTVPGFPIAASAAGQPLAQRIGSQKTSWVAGVEVALVAAGLVHRPEPWQLTASHHAGLIDALTRRLAALESIVDPLRPMAASAIREQVLGTQS